MVVVVTFVRPAGLPIASVGRPVLTFTCAARDACVMAEFDKMILRIKA